MFLFTSCVASEARSSLSVRTWMITLAFTLLSFGPCDKIVSDALFLSISLSLDFALINFGLTRTLRTPSAERIPTRTDVRSEQERAQKRNKDTWERACDEGATKEDRARRVWTLGNKRFGLIFSLLRFLFSFIVFFFRSVFLHYSFLLFFFIIHLCLLSLCPQKEKILLLKTVDS